MKLKKLKLRQRIRIALIFRYPGWYLWNSERKQKSLRRKYCHKGIHKLRTGGESTYDGKRWTHYRYLTCQFCQAKIFTSEKELQRYHKYTRDQKVRSKKVFSELMKHPSEPKSKQYSGSGRCGVEKVSTSKPSGQVSK